MTHVEAEDDREARAEAQRACPQSKPDAEAVVQSERGELPGRSTFLCGREILEASRRSLEGARRALRALPPGTPRSELLRGSLETLQRELSRALGDFADTAPNEVLGEQAQYTAELPRGPEACAPPDSLEAALDGSLALTRSLGGRFQKLADSAVAATVGEAYSNLAQLVAGYEKRIARLSEGEHDL